MSDLRISENLSLPLEAATWVISYLAKRGAGKTYNASVQAEEMLKVEIPIVVVDGMGIWWGLRVSNDGIRSGMPVVVFGGEHADLTLVPEKAAEMAKAVVESNISCVLDLSGFSKYAARKVVSGFLNELYRLNRVERHVFIEEADLWAPQRPIGQEEALCLSAVDNFVRRGGNHNLGCTLITQRSAVLNKDILTQSDCLVVLRTLAPQDKKAIQAWVEEQTDEDKTELNKWYDSLKELENGEAWVWHPEKPSIFVKVKFRQRETFHATREFIRSPKASKIILMGVDEFVTRFKKVFESNPAPLQKTMTAPGAVSPDVKRLEAELEEFRSGRKIVDSVEQRLKFLGEVKVDLEKRIRRYEEELKGSDELAFALRKLLRIQNIYDNIHKVEEIAKSTSKVPETSPSGTVVLTETVPEIYHKIERPIVEMSEANLEGRLVTLCLQGFFNSKRRSGAISAEVTRAYAVQVNLGDLNKALGGLVQKKILQREEASNRGWEYLLYPGAKERIKESS